MSTMNIRGKLTRRRLLTGFGASAAAAPFLPLFVRQAASSAAFPKRLIVFCTPNGTVMDKFWAQGGGFTLGEILEPLAPLQSKLIQMRGLDMESAYKAPVPKDHLPDFINLLTGRQAEIYNDGNSTRFTGISIDQHIGQAIGHETKFSTLQLGVQTGGYAARVSSLGYDQPVAPETNPANAFNSIFSDLTTDPFELEQMRAQRKSVLDIVHEEVAELECQLGTEERPKFQSHIEAIRELEKSIELGANDLGGHCAAPELEPGVDANAGVNFPLVGRQQMDIIAMALACDLTRVITLQWHQGASNKGHDWINISGSHHGISHGSEGVTASEAERLVWLAEIERWYAEQFFYLCSKLDSMPEGDGTMLDHSAILWAHEQSNGATHQRRDMPFVLAGGCHGVFETGRRIDFGGVPHNGLLISLANAMDVPTTEFGDPDFSHGPLSDL